MKNFYGQVDVNTEKHCIGRLYEVTKCLMHLEDRTVPKKSYVISELKLIKIT